ncbi:MAG: hypothetical protein ACYSWQ_03040 [Planctomycetota bacterium]|jgi:hypothetical protein
MISKLTLKLVQVWWAGFKVLCRWCAFAIVLAILSVPAMALADLVHSWAGYVVGIIFVLFVVPIVFYLTSRYLLLLGDNAPELTHDGESNPRKDQHGQQVGHPTASCCERKMNRKKKILIWIVALLVVIPLVLAGLPYERRHYCCVPCRLVKSVEHYCGLPITRQTHNECSRWYVSRHPDHEHEWVKSSCTYSRSLFGKKWECGRGHSVFSIPPATQKAFLESCTPEQEAKWFELLDSRDWEDREQAQKMAADAFFAESAT